MEPARKTPASERSLTHSPYFQGPLYERMSEDLHLAGMARRTHEGCLRAVRTLADFCRRTPDQISEDQLRKYFLHLKNDRRFASGSLRVAFSGIKFFCTRTCRRQWGVMGTQHLVDVAVNKMSPRFPGRRQVFVSPRLNTVIKHQRLASGKNLYARICECSPCPSQVPEPIEECGRYRSAKSESSAVGHPCERRG